MNSNQIEQTNRLNSEKQKLIELIVEIEKFLEAKRKFELNSLRNIEDIFITQINNQNFKSPFTKIDLNLIISEEKIYENLICIVCLDLSDNPNACEKCEKICCKECIKKIDDTCPFCRYKPYSTRALSLIEKSILNSLKLNCPYECGEIIYYERYHYHLNTCRNKLKTFNCNNCKEIFELQSYPYTDIVNTHLSKCEKKCIYCSLKIPLIDFVRHEYECLEKILLSKISSSIHVVK